MVETWLIFGVTKSPGQRLGGHPAIHPINCPQGLFRLVRLGKFSITATSANQAGGENILALIGLQTRTLLSECGGGGLPSNFCFSAPPKVAFSFEWTPADASRSTLNLAVPSESSSSFGVSLFSCFEVFVFATRSVQPSTWRFLVRGKSQAPKAATAIVCLEVLSWFSGWIWSRGSSSHVARSVFNPFAGLRKKIRASGLLRAPATASGFGFRVRPIDGGTHVSRWHQTRVEC